MNTLLIIFFFVGGPKVLVMADVVGPDSQQKMDAPLLPVPVPVCDIKCIQKIHSMCLLNKTGIIDPGYFGLHTVCSQVESVGVVGYIASGITLQGQGIGVHIEAYNNSSANILLFVQSYSAMNVDHVQVNRLGIFLSATVIMNQRPFHFMVMAMTGRGAIRCLRVSAGDTQLEERNGWGINLRKSSDCH